MVLASVELPAGGGLPDVATARVDYITLAPDIQQSSNRDRAQGPPRPPRPLQPDYAAAQ